MASYFGLEYHESSGIITNKLYDSIPYFDALRERVQIILSSASEIRTAIVDQDPEYQAFENQQLPRDRLYDLKCRYIKQEAKRIDKVRPIGDEIKSVYSDLKQTLEGVVKKAGI